MCMQHFETIWQHAPHATRFDVLSNAFASMHVNLNIFELICFMLPINHCNWKMWIVGKLFWRLKQAVEKLHVLFSLQFLSLWTGKCTNSRGSWKVFLLLQILLIFNEIRYLYSVNNVAQCAMVFKTTLVTMVVLLGFSRPRCKSVGCYKTRIELKTVLSGIVSLKQWNVFIKLVSFDPN